MVADMFISKILVSTLAPVKGATLLTKRKTHEIYSFNSRSREGSDGSNASNEKAIGVSTLAPVKGATTLGAIFCFRRFVSTLAPVKGATSAVCRSK